MQPDLTELLNQLLSSGVTACFTVFGGVIVLTLGQVMIKFFIEPLDQYAKLRGEIAHSLAFYGNVYGSDNREKTDEASETLRRQASRLRATAWTLRGYWLWRLLGWVPKKKNVIKASATLIGLSNSMAGGGRTHERREEIKSLLHLR